MSNGLDLQTIKFDLIIRTQMVLENTFKEKIKCYQLFMQISRIYILNGGPCWGREPAESCTHPAKRDRCFS